jgi:protein translocase SecG subunit
MSDALAVVQIILAVLLTALILLQGRGSGLSASFGGMGRTFQTRRGIEKVFFYATIVSTVLLVISIMVSVAV